MTRIRFSSSSYSGSGGSIDSFLRFFGLHSDGSNQKGNKGKGAAQRRMKFLGLILLLLVCLLGVVHLCFPANSATNGVVRHATKLRRKIKNFQQQHPKKKRKKRDDDHFSHEELMDLVVEGKLNLVEINADKRTLAETDDDTYEGVYGIFCRLNFDAHKKDPSAVPMFRDMVARSPKCEGEYNPDNPADNRGEFPRGRIELDLKQVAERARQADEKEEEGLTPANNLDLKGVVFHESRCGSTLVANGLIAMNPKKHRVYSESAPPITALQLCARAVEQEEEKKESNNNSNNDDEEGDDDPRVPCTVDQGAQILRDVMFLMGRSDDPDEERYFFKIQSSGTRLISVFRRAFPNTPWIFVYRNPVEVLMSHFAQGTRSANCLRYKNNPPLILQRLARKRGYDAEIEAPARGGKKRNKKRNRRRKRRNDDDTSGGGGDHRGGGGGRSGGGRRGDDDENEGRGRRKLSSLERMGPHEFCSAHLATLTETAADHIQDSNGIGRAVNYASLPNILYEKILPAWDVPVSDTEIENIQKISGVYSKGRGNMKGEWHEDSEKKEKMASPEIVEASKTFLQDSFDRLETLASSY